MIQLAWRFLMFQKDSALAQWYRARTKTARATRKTMIVALARKLGVVLHRIWVDGSTFRYAEESAAMPGDFAAKGTPAALVII